LAAVNDAAFVANESVRAFVYWFTFINLLLMIFNLIPLGPLDGHYILPYFLPKNLSRLYRELNQQYGGFAVLGLVLLSYVGLPIFGVLRSAAHWWMDVLQVIG